MFPEVRNTMVEKGIVPTITYERDAVGRIQVEDGCIRGAPSHVRNQKDLLFPEEENVKDPGEYLVEPGEWKKSDMFFEYRIKEGEELRCVEELIGNDSRHICALWLRSSCLHVIPYVSGLLFLGVWSSFPGPPPVCRVVSFTQVFSHRLKGNELFKQGKYADAAVLYRKGLYYSVFDDSQVC